ncbi:eukaryotic translation initiation factor 2 beta subunit [Polyplosphaeria fusca]|uniref:Eukaryotic translation initiation factor 2 beta subunit n=1 Tax=Polyplosphaeria fusca TaxID=682080 RepID=A0A9P4UY74_9PLEO|nr:eukaryotic translation initiation factor 2 beta subunit [Polyplosphaeria fusca]
MADVAESPTERKPRKSVAFSEGATIVDENGEVTTGTTETKDGESAERHSSGKSPSNGVATNEDDGTYANTAVDAAVDEVTDMFAGLQKKKKKKSSKPKDDDDEAKEDGANGEFDPSALKLKKKKKKTPKVDADDFEAALKEREQQEGEQKEEEPVVEEGDMFKGTGVWQHDATSAISYNLLLNRFFTLLHSQHPDLASSGGKSYKIPPPQCLREGNKKTIFANISEIAKRIKRTDEHLTQFLFAELGTSGSVDGSRRLVIKGRFQQKQIENVLRRYIVEYVTCKTCRSPDTQLSKGENRLHFVTCNSCASRRSVAAIKTGFSAQIGKRKRQQG